MSNIPSNTEEERRKLARNILQGWARESLLELAEDVLVEEWQNHPERFETSYEEHYDEADSGSL